MADLEDDTRFFERLAPVTAFHKAAEIEAYTRLPDDWWIGVCDIVASTQAIRDGRYRAVNIVGASAIAGLRNLWPEDPAAFAFEGDGCAFVVPASRRVSSAGMLADCARWALDNTGLVLRIAMVPVADARAAGHDVLVARYELASGVSYALFAGGGVAWAEHELKAGRYGIGPAPAGNRPDLHGLSCNWAPVDSRHGKILSLIVQPQGESGSENFGRVVGDLLAIIDGSSAPTHPLPDEGPRSLWLPSAFRLNTDTMHDPDAPRWFSRLWLAMTMLFGWVVVRANLRLGGFDARAYRRGLHRNADYRKFDDGLRMTLDCPPDLIDRITAHLERARTAGWIDYGLHTQAQALITCLVPSIRRDDHLHFIDGADGGYVAAATMLKAMQATPTAERVAEKDDAPYLVAKTGHAP